MIMIRQNNVTSSSSSFKVFLMLIAAVFAAAAVILIISLTSASTVTGRSPFLAISLADGVNTGVLGPGNQRWFKLTSPNPEQAGELEQALTVIFTPDDGNRARLVNLQIFEENQLPFFYFGDASKMKNLGAGQIVSRDNNHETGELFWTGWISGQKNYYVQVINGSDATIDYWLFPDNIVSYPLGETQTTETVAAPIGADPGNPEPLASGAAHNILKPHTTRWYIFTAFDPGNPNKFEDMSFSMFFTPDDGQRRHFVNFELYPMSAFDMWQRGQANQLVNFGAGMLVSRDGGDNTGERLWRGALLKGDSYLIAVENESDIEIEYWLFEGDIEHLELGLQAISLGQ